MFDRLLNVAPMMGCTDRHCRFLFRLLSPDAVLYSEMLVTGALIHGDSNRFLAHNHDTPAAVQLGGSNPDELAISSRLVEQAGYQEINLNVGCPSDRVQQGGIGACLMADPRLVADCYLAMQESVSIPVTIKSRIGIDNHEDYPFFNQFITTLYDEGCRIFHVHARKAYLSGLSPRENREIPPLKYDFVAKVQSSFPDAVFILNGGIKTVDQSVDLLTRFKGVMLGRAPYNNPFLLAELQNKVYGTPLPSRFDVIAAYRRYIEQEMDSGERFRHLAKHLFGLFTGIPGARSYRRYLSTHMNSDDADATVLDRALGQLNALETA